MLQAPTPETKNSSEASRSSVPAEPEHVLHPRHGTLQNPYANGTPSDSRSPHLATHLQRHISGLHRTLGNQAVLHLLSHRAPALQTKLTINQPGDQYEQEADHVADHVMRMPDPAAVADSSPPSASFSGSASVPHLQRKCACGGSTEAGSVCPECEKKELMRSAAGPASAAEAPSIVHDVIRSPGQPLDHSTRAFMEPRFGRDFSHVRIHADSSSSESASAISAQAYTVGRDIVFNTSNYSPQTTHGLRLIAHELAHVVQQTGATARPENGRSVQRTCRESLAQHSFRSADGMAQRSCPKPPTRLADTPLTFDKECDESQQSIAGQMFFFCEDSDVLTDESQVRMELLVPEIQQLPHVEIHGFASPEGPKGREQAYNLTLSCYRARAIESFLVSKGVLPGRIKVFKHGGTVEFGKKEKNRVAIIPNVKLITPQPLTNRFRVAALSFLACAECNPFTDDSSVTTSPLSPPKVEPPSGSSFRMKHWIEVEVISDDSIHIKSSKVVSAGQEAGHSGYCGKTFPGEVLFKSGVVGPTSGTDPIHGASVELESEFKTQVGAVVPATLPDAPCGPLGKSPKIPPISNRFRMKIFADGTKESGFVFATSFPFHHLYEDGSVKLFKGVPVRPAVDFDTWATSTGVSKMEATVGFKALRVACCEGSVPGCAVTCNGGVSEVPTGAFVPSGDLIQACLGAGAALAIKSCPSPCGPAGTSCPIPTLPPNP